MNSKRLEGLRLAMLVTDGFEEVELTKPREALQAEGARVDIVAPNGGKVQSFNHFDKSKLYDADASLADAKVNTYDGLVLPGGALSPDALRTMPDAVAFVKTFFEENKPVAAICHGPWTLVEADVVNGLTLTSWPSLQTDIRNAGGVWLDQEVVADRNLVTSRKPDDIPAFNERAITLFSEITRPAAEANR